MLNNDDDCESSEESFEHQHGRYQAFGCDSPASGAKAPWTSARCHRLLRPISSKIALLRKERQTSSFEENLRNHRAPTRPTSANPRPAGSVSGDEWERNPRPRKKIRRTYSSKARKHGCIVGKEYEKDASEPSQHLADTEIGLPPCLAKASEDGETVLASHSLSSSTDARQVCRKSFQTVPRTSREKLIEGLYKGLEALLQATTSSVTSRPSKCRSLFSTCLRQVPTYIAEEEKLMRLDEPDSDPAVSSDVYNDLEGIGPDPSGGWKPLREVVRAHGIYMIGSAIKKGLLGTKIARNTVNTCMRLGAHDEAQQIIIWMISASKPDENPVLDDAIHRLDRAKEAFTTINDFAIATRRHGFLYQQAANLLDNHILSLDWISDKIMIQCWNGVIQSLVRRDEYAAAGARFLRVVISKLFGKPEITIHPEAHDLRLHSRRVSHRSKLRSAITSQGFEGCFEDRANAAAADPLSCVSRNSAHSTIVKVLTVMSAMSILDQSSPVLPSQRSLSPITTVLGDLAVVARRCFELESYSIDLPCTRGIDFEVIFLCLLAADISSLVSRETPSLNLLGDCTSLRGISAFQISTATIAEAASFIYSIARCYAQASSKDAVDCLQERVNDLLTFVSSKKESKTMEGLCGRVALATAFALAEDTGHLNHLDWALEVEVALKKEVICPKAPSFDKTPIRGKRKDENLYRWEEGICEWIAKTPALLLRTSSALEVDTTNQSNVAKVQAVNRAQKMPFVSEPSPSNMQESTTREEVGPVRTERVAVCVRIASKRSCGDSGDCEMTPFREIHKRSKRKKVCLPAAPENIYSDGDMDELSTPESSQEKPSKTITLRQLYPGSMSAQWKRQPIKKASNSTMTVKSREHDSDRVFDLHIFGTEDELSAL